VTGLAPPLTLETALRLLAELRVVVEEQAETIAQRAETIAQQAETIAQQAKTIAQQAKAIQKQNRRGAVLEEKVRQNSSNSSKPPSSDAPGKKRTYPKKKPSGKKRGGQPGHKKHERVLLPVEKARSVTDCIPTHCELCDEPLSGEDPCPKRHQIIDLPPIEPVVDEWRIYTLTCGKRSCGHRTEGKLPEGVSTLGYGPGVDAMVGQFAGEMRCSKRTTSEAMTKVLHVPMCTGAVIDAQCRVSAALAAPCQEALEHAQQQSVKNADETGWKEGVTKAYIWVCVTAWVTVFLILPSRAATSAETLLGVVRGVLGTDRYVGYAWWPSNWRQVCWAHLVRDFRAIAERGGSSGLLGASLLLEAERMFAWWKRLKEGDMKRTTFRVYMRSLRKRVEALLLQGCSDPNKQTAGTCKEMWKIREAFWTFVRIEGVEPTNNAAEQAVRFGVLWRKMCGGTKSKKGSEFVARILTVHATLRQQNRSVHGYLRQACEAHRAGKPAPSLVPKAVA